MLQFSHSSNVYTFHHRMTLMNSIYSCFLLNLCTFAQEINYYYNNINCFVTKTDNCNKRVKNNDELKRLAKAGKGWSKQQKSYINKSDAILTFIHDGMV